MKQNVPRALLILVLVIYLFAKNGESACKSETAALYDVQFETFWSRKDFPKHYPEWRPPASWSKMIGFSHDDSFEVFRKGEASTPALKLFAEKADCSLFDLHSQGSGGIFDAFSLPPIATGVGAAKAVMIASGNHTKISVISKIIPSPDWFVGVDSYDLCPNGIWLDYVNLELAPLDAGTDNGLTFTSPNWPTNPQDKIQPITAHYPSHPAGSFYYPTIDELPVLTHLSASKKREFTLKDNFDAADYINVIPEDKKDIYRYDIEGNKDSNHISIDNPDRLKNQVDIIPEEKRRQYLHRRFGNSKNQNGNRIKYNKYPNKKNTWNKLSTTVPPSDISDNKDKDNVLTIAPNSSTTPATPSPSIYPKIFMNRTRLFPGKRTRVHPTRGRKRIPSGDVMAVIDDIVKDYQKEHRRKIKKRRREERKRRREQMKKIKPPRDCRVSEWGEWSPCSKTCGIGEQTRTREILKHARRGGKPCPVLEETTWCGSARACQRDYFRWQ